MAYDVEYYEKENGERPAEKFILSQEKKMQAKIFMALELLEEMGHGCGSHSPSRWETGYLKSGRRWGRTSAGCSISSSWAARSS